MPIRARGKILTLIACGETTWGRDGRLLGSADLPLSNSGLSLVKADADHLAAELGIDEHGATSAPFPTIYHPPDDAAQVTAQTFADRLGSKTRSASDLHDPNLGLLEGLTADMFAERYPRRSKQYHEDPLTMSPPEGEPIVDARSRLFKAVVRLMTRRRKAKATEIAIVLHNLNLGLLRCWLAGRSSRDLWDLVRQRPRVERYTISPEQIEQLAAAAEEAEIES